MDEASNAGYVGDDSSLNLLQDNAEGSNCVPAYPNDYYSWGVNSENLWLGGNGNPVANDLTVTISESNGSISVSPNDVGMSIYSSSQAVYTSGNLAEWDNSVYAEQGVVYGYGPFLTGITNEVTGQITAYLNTTSGFSNTTDGWGGGSYIYTTNPPTVAFN